MAATPQLPLAPLSPRGWGHRVPKDTQTLQTERTAGSQRKNPTRPGRRVPRAAPHGAIPVPPHTGWSRDPVPTGHPSADEAGTWQPRSRPSGARPAQAGSQRASRCPRCRDKLPSEPPMLPSPAPHPSFAHSLLSLCTSVSLHKTHPPAAARPPTSPHAHPGMAMAPRSVPQLLPHNPRGSHHAQWGQGLGRGAMKTLSPGRRQRGQGVRSPSLAFHGSFPIPDAPLSAKMGPARVSFPTGPCRRGSPRLHPSPALDAGGGTPCTKSCCRGQGRTKAIAKGVEGVSASCPKLGIRQKIPLAPIPRIPFHATGTFAMSLTPPGKGQGLLRGRGENSGAL